MATHLRGWRSWVLGLSPLPLLVVLLALGEEWRIALLLTVGAAIPVLAAVLILTVDTSRTDSHVRQIIGPEGRIPTDISSLDRRVEVLDSVLSSETRRPWEPTTFPLHYVGDRDPKPILLLPGADYHLPEIVAIADELDSIGVPNVIAVGQPHWERTGDGLIWYDREIHAAPRPEDIPGRFAALLTMKDWAGYGPLVEVANDAGIPTFAKVEGAQDFHDLDTNQPRRPYRTARHILCQGQNDYDALDGMERTVVGSTRLERLWWAPPANPPKPLALINLNFTYGVLTGAREQWLQTAIEGCEAAKMPYVISVHPAEKARRPHPKASSISASRLLRHATVLISRFSTLPLEAMVRGVPFIYHNPHAESAALYAGPMAPFETTLSSESIAAALRDLPDVGYAQRERVAAWLGERVSIEKSKRSEQRSVRAILAQVSAS